MEPHNLSPSLPQGLEGKKRSTTSDAGRKSVKSEKKGHTHLTSVGGAIIVQVDSPDISSKTHR